MTPTPAPRVGALPSDRTSSLDWSWDWLGNNTSWNDDADSFYERSAGRISNGVGDTGLTGATSPRPSALYLASTVPTTANGLADGTRDGWVEVQYGVSGNVTSYTVHGACDDTTTNSCWDDTSLSLSSRITQLRAGCTCTTEQHYDYRWDELNRLVDARRYDRSGGNWNYGARIRTLYDGANQRTVKQSFSAPNTVHRYALYVYPGDFERRGLTQGALTYDAVTTAPATETQYVVAGARVVWDSSTDVAPGSDLDRNRRITMPITDLLGTSSAVVDLASLELLEASTYYPNGARENLWASDLQAVPLEPNGFTEKEADEEVGATYFGERWLISRLGRWASPDPLHVHSAGGGEVQNSFHYISGSLLSGRDPLGLRRSAEAEAASRRLARAQEDLVGGIVAGVMTQLQVIPNPAGDDATIEYIGQSRLRLAGFALGSLAVMSAEIAGGGTIAGGGWMSTPVTGPAAAVPVVAGAVVITHAVVSQAHCRVILDAAMSASAPPPPVVSPASPTHAPTSGPTPAPPHAPSPSPSTPAPTTTPPPPPPAAPHLFPNRFPRERPLTFRRVSSEEARLLGRGRRLLYVVREDGELVLSRPRSGGGDASHIDLARGESVRAAGEVRFGRDGTIVIDNSSGHYQPQGAAPREAALDAFAREGFDPTRTTYVDRH